MHVYQVNPIVGRDFLDLSRLSRKSFALPGQIPGADLLLLIKVLACIFCLSRLSRQKNRDFRDPDVFFCRCFAGRWRPDPVAADCLNRQRLNLIAWGGEVTGHEFLGSFPGRGHFAVAFLQAKATAR